MNPIRPTQETINSELTYVASRSGGPGGQNVNKVNSKVTLRWDIGRSSSLTGDQKEVIRTKLRSRINAEGILVIVAQEKRSQLQNKELAVHKLDELLTKAFTVKKARKPSKPSRAIRKARLENKKRLSEKKQLRKRVQ